MLAIFGADPTYEVTTQEVLVCQSPVFKNSLLCPVRAEWIRTDRAFFCAMGATLMLMLGSAWMVLMSLEVVQSPAQVAAALMDGISAPGSIAAALMGPEAKTGAAKATGNKTRAGAGKSRVQKPAGGRGRPSGRAPRAKKRSLTTR